MCEWGEAKFLIFSENVFGNLIYYSHLLPLVVTLLLALFIFFHNKRSLAARWFLTTAALLSLWLFFDLILWATEKPSYTMFFWSLINMIEPLIYAGMLFFMYAFLDKEMSFRQKLLVFFLALPTVIFASTGLNLQFYDLTNCYREAVEGSLPYYGYLVEAILAIWILIVGMERKAWALTFGAVFFLLSFAMGNVVGSLLVDWELGQHGLFGIPVFAAMISYLIVKYKAFHVKLIATQVLVTSLWILTLAILFIRRIENVRIIVLFTLILFTALGYFLIRSVRKEVTLREELEVANSGQADLLHIINHQIKGYMTKARLVFDDLLNDASYGLGEKAKPMIEEGFKSMTEGVTFVQNFLNASNIERGTFTYNMVPIDFKKIVEEQAVAMKTTAEEKGLKFELKINEGKYDTIGDQIQLSQAVKNLIDNSIKYTPHGSINCLLSTKNSRILFTIHDTGVGISEELKPKLFTKGGRDKDSQKINVNSTGFGLAFVKGVVEAHKGRVWAESPGVNKGSKFCMELPVVNHS